MQQGKRSSFELASNNENLKKVFSMLYLNDDFWKHASEAQNTKLVNDLDGYVQKLNEIFTIVNANLNQQSTMDDILKEFNHFLNKAKRTTNTPQILIDSLQLVVDIVGTEVIKSIDLSKLVLPPELTEAEKAQVNNISVSSPLAPETKESPQIIKAKETQKKSYAIAKEDGQKLSDKFFKSASEAAGRILDPEKYGKIQATLASIPVVGFIVDTALALKATGAFLLGIISKGIELISEAHLRATMYNRSGVDKNGAQAAQGLGKQVAANALNGAYSNAYSFRNVLSNNPISPTLVVSPNMAKM